MSEKATSQKPAIKPSEVRDAPTSFFAIIRHLGPGLIVAGSIVGSGELIATTATGAKAGIWLLWLIIVGCVIKVFVQVELGRYAISSGQTTMTALDSVPGPRIPNRGNWLIWYWFIMFVAGIAQLGGIVGGVGQALSIAAPLTEYGRRYDEVVKVETELSVLRAQIMLGARNAPGNVEQIATEILQEEVNYAKLRSQFSQSYAGKDGSGVSVFSATNFEEKLVAVPQNAETALTLVALYDWTQRTNVSLESILSTIEHVPFEKYGSLDEDVRESLRQLNSIYEGKDQKTKEMMDSYIHVRKAGPLKAPVDDKIWATIIALATAVILYLGRFNLIQSFSTTMVALFTLVTIVNLFLLQSSEAWSFSFSEIMNGLKFRLPPVGETSGGSALGVALATFGIIGVGAAELVAYPYWCLEKGYGRFTGGPDKSAEWAERARGWMRIMRIDAWCSMVVYTFATVAFYLLGAAVLGRTKLEPAGTEMIRYLAVMYSPVFGEWAGILFLFGAFAVLYSTFFVANAGHARTVSDALQVMGFAKSGEAAYRWRVKIMSGLFPIACLVVYLFFPQPVVLVLLSGLMQALMLPMLAFAALWFRYRKIDRRIAPGFIWDIFLIVSAVGMFLFGLWAGWDKIQSFFFQ